MLINVCAASIHFFLDTGDPTRPEAEGLIAILISLISLPFMESIDDQTDHQWQLLQVIEGASSMLHPKDHQILSMPIKSINLLIAIRTRARLNRFILCHWRHLSDCQQQLVNLDF